MAKKRQILSYLLYYDSFYFTHFHILFLFDAKACINGACRAHRGACNACGCGGGHHRNNLPHTENNWLTERTDNTEDAVATPAEDRFISDFEQSEKSKFRGFRERTNNSVRNTNSVRIKSTRGVNISRHETDTTSTLRITLRPDTVFVPYTNHIRSDTIIVPDRICKTKLQKTQTANALLILILIAIIIFLLKDRKTR